MAPSPALDSWIVWAHLQKATSSFPRALEQFHDHWRYYRGETAYGLRNADAELRPPIAGSFENPLHYGSEAIGRAVYWGLAFHGKPDLACERAFLDASIDHAGEGAIAPAAIARMIACAVPGVSVPELIRAGTAILPKDSLCMKVAPIVLKSAGSADGVRIISETLSRTIEVSDPEHAALSFGYVLMGLAEGHGNFERGICVPASCGGATEASCIAVGALLGLAQGSISEDWAEQIGDAYVAGSGIRNLDPPETIENFVSMVEESFERDGLDWWMEVEQPIEALPVADVLDALKESANIEETSDDEPEEPDASEESPEVESEPEFLKRSIPAPDQDVLTLISAEPKESLCEFTGLRIAVEYIDPPLAQPACSIRMVLHLQNTEEETKIVDPKVEVPSTWDHASKLGEFRSRPQELTSFPIVVKPRGSDPVASNSLKLRVDHHEKKIPIFGAQPWYWVGPFTNFDGEGFTTQYPAESDISLGRVFNSRDGSATSWSLEYFPGTIFDLERFFRGDSGAVLLYTQMRLNPGRYTLMLVSDVSARVKVHDREIIAYHDRAQPAPRPSAPYVGQFETQDLTRISIKVLRAKEPLRPFVFTIFDEEGRAVTPLGFETL